MPVGLGDLFQGIAFVDHRLELPGLDELLEKSLILGGRARNSADDFRGARDGRPDRSQTELENGRRASGASAQDIGTAPFDGFQDAPTAALADRTYEVVVDPAGRRRI